MCPRGLAPTAVVCVSSQLCIQWHHVGNFMLVMGESSYTMKIGKCETPGLSFPGLVFKTFTSIPLCVCPHLRAFYAASCKVSPLYRSLYLIPLWRMQFYFCCIGHRLYAPLNLLSPCHTLTTASETTHMQIQSDKALGLACTCVLPWDVAELTLGSPLTCTYKPNCPGELVPVGPPWLTNRRWQSLTMPPHLVSQEHSFEMHFLNLPNDWALYLYFLMQSDFSRKGDNGSERLTYLSIIDYAAGWWRKWDLNPHQWNAESFQAYILPLPFNPIQPLTLPSSPLRAAPVRTFQALGRIQLETTYLSSNCLLQHILSSFVKFSLAASSMLLRITFQRHSGIEAWIPGSALRGSQPNISSESVDTCLSILCLSCCHTHRVK